MNNARISNFTKMMMGQSCDALIEVEAQVWARCGKYPVELHHRLPRSRGGLLLDAVDETYHLLALCRQHHQYAHENIDAFNTGLMLEGKVITKYGRPIYVGPDPYLTSEHGPEAHQSVEMRGVREELSSAEHGESV